MAEFRGKVTPRLPQLPQSKLPKPTAPADPQSEAFKKYGNQPTPVQGFGGSGGYQADPRQRASGNLDKWNTGLPPGYRLTPMGNFTVNQYEGPQRGFGPGMQRETPFISSDEMINDMPNSELLTPSERWLYNALPRVMDKQVFGKPVGDWFEDFNEGWAGKALNALDIPAEGLERGFGFLSQWSDANLYGTDQDKEEFNNQLAEAWYAGGLWADMTNLPGFKRDEEGKLTGVTIPGHLPGRSGIVNARRRLAELTSQGVDYGEALKQVRTEYYTDLGALSIRAQMQDTYQHILLDPLNVLTAYLKPVEAVKARSIAAMTGKIDNLDDLTRIATETAEAAAKLKDAGKLDEAARMADDAAKITERISSLKDMPQIDQIDRMAMWLTGSDPLKGAPTTTLGKLGQKLNVFNPFSLTSDARAYEMLTTVSDNVDAYILSRMDDPADIMDAIYRAERGALGPEFGHAFLTKEGRVSQAALSASRAQADELYSRWMSTAAERGVLDDIARITGDKVEALVKDIEDGNAAQLVSRLRGMGDEGAAMADNITDEFVEMVSTFRKGEIPLSTDMFKMQLSNEIRDATAQLAIARFGVKNRGLIMKASHALKSAETLAFLRVNPTFVMKNFFNNEMTMIARGLGGPLPLGAADDFVDLIGFTPHRFGQAFTAAGEQFGVKLGKGEQAIADVLRGEKGFLSKVDEMFQKAGDKLGPLDMGNYASKMEASASKRAFMNGYMQGWNRYFWKPGKSYKTMAQSIPAEILDDLPAEFVRALERRISGVMNEDQLRGVAALDNLNATSAGMAESIVREYGYRLDDRFGADYVKKLEIKLDEVIPQGRAAVRRVIEEARQDAQTHLDELAEAAHQGRIDKIAATVELSGPEGLLKVYGDAIDEIHGGQLAYDVRMSKLDPTGLTGETANIWWGRTKADADAFWNRQWTRFDEVIAGMKKGAKNITDANGKPMRIPAQVSDGYKGISKGWKGFISKRNKLHQQFFDAIIKGEQPKVGWPDIQRTLYDDYQKMMRSEYDLTVKIDDAITAMVRRSDPDAAKAFSAWRKRARDLRLERRNQLQEFRTSIEGMSPKGKQEAWRDYWTEVQKMDNTLRDTENAATAVLQGDEMATGAGNQMDELTGASAGEGIREIANRYGILSATEEGIPFDERIRLTVNKYMRGGYDEAATEELTKLLDDLEVPADFDPSDINVGNKVSVMVREGEGEVIRRMADSSTGRPRWKIQWEDGSTSIHQGISVNRIPDELPPPVQGWVRPEDAMQYDDIARIHPDLAEEAFEARRVYRGDPEVPPRPEVEPQQYDFVNGAAEVIPDEPPIGVGSDQQWLGNGFSGLDDIEAEALKRMDDPAVNWASLTDEQEAAVQTYLRQVEGQMADAKLASTKYGEFKRDSALLNYNRRYNYNNWLSTIMPFEFWTTQSLAKWALHSIDRPAMLTTALRMKKLWETAGMKQNGFPSRLQGSVRIGVPFLPDWMGDSVFIDPLRTLLPFDNWASAYEQYTGDQQGLEGRTERLLASMVESGQISSEEADQAMNDRAGPTWERAIEQAKQNDGEGMNDAWDYANMLLSPHAPLLWAKEALIDKTPENIGPLTPISRTMKQAFGVLGIDTSQSKYNVGGNIRKELGLPAFDKWDDYRVERELSNMATEGYNLTDIKLAMIEQQGPLWDEASSRAAKVFAGGGAIPFLLKTLGIPTQAYPIGEQHQRALQDDFSAAYEAYDNGNVDALTGFFNNYPEYEARLALWDEPEERLRQFQVDNIWNDYHEMPSLHKRQLRDALGDEFQQLFLDRDTRNYEAISNETLQVWSKMMNGDPPGSLNSPVQPLQFADSDEAWRVQQFYDLRRSLYPHYNELQDIYFKLDDDAKKKYRNDNPELTAYWDWRRDFFHKNPAIVPYLDDDFEFKYESPEDIPTQTQVPQYTFEEWSYVLGSRSVANVLSSGDIPVSAEGYVENIADQLNMSVEELSYLVSQSSR